MWSDGLARAQALVQANRPELALKELARLPAAEGTSQVAFKIRTAALLNMKRWGPAIQAAHQGLAEGPDADLFADLGGALSEVGDHDEAEQWLWQGLALSPQNVRLLCFYANHCVRTDRIRDAVEFVGRAAAVDPHDSLVYAVRIQVALAEGKKSQAQRISEEYLAEYPEEARAHLMHGAVAGRRGRLAAAYSSLGLAVAHDPADQTLARAAVQTRVFTHPLLMPVRPLYRLGLVGNYVLLIVVVAVVCGLGGPPWALAAGGIWFAYNLYGRAVLAFLRWRDERRAAAR